MNRTSYFTPIFYMFILYIQNASASSTLNLSGMKDGLLLESRFDGPALAYNLMQTFMSDEDWQAEVRRTQDRYQTWSQDNGGRDISHFLNDRLLIKALGAAGGEIEKIQRGVVWLALYKEFKQGAHPRVIQFLSEHQNSVSRLLTDFSWEKAALYVKEKKWRQDIEERKGKRKTEVPAEQGTETAEPPRSPVFLPEVQPEPQIVFHPLARYTRPVEVPWSGSGWPAGACLPLSDE